MILAVVVAIGAACAIAAVCTRSVFRRRMAWAGYFAAFITSTTLVAGWSVNPNHVVAAAGVAAMFVGVAVLAYGGVE